MCGIFCSLTIGSEDGKPDERTKTLLHNRGPDLHSEHQVQCDDFTVTFAGFVLWQQGMTATAQPVVTRDHILLFNGDIYSTGSLTSKTLERSDTDWLFAQIAECNEETDFFHLMKQIQGPFSLIYFSNQSKKLYFVRDSLGRQTLLIGSYRNSIYITSVASKAFAGSSFIEVPPLGIFSINLSSSADGYDIRLNMWQGLVNEHFTEQLRSITEVLGSPIALQENLEPFWMQTNDHRSDCYTFTSLLSEHIHKSPLDILTLLSESREMVSVSDELIDLLTTSLKHRVEATPQFCKNCIKSKDINRCNHPKVGILFSGGIDCSILALLADRFMDQTTAIDLINVSFEKINRNPSSVNKMIENYETPDRLTGRETLKELMDLCPNRTWNFIEVNVTREELKEALKEKISDLCYPLNSILDESLGAALWFAASAKGLVNSVQYESPCRVLLIGSGADELFGGYTRHRNAFLRSGQSWTNLDDELNLDWTRLPSRNLARDDRIIGDRSVTARSPFVEENVAFYVRNLRSSQKCFHLLPEGIGDKLLLRLCGFRLGLRNVCWLKKRALQFGSRVADRKQNAKDVSDALR